MTVSTDSNAVPPASPEERIYVLTESDRVSAFLSWAFDFDLIDWYPDGAGGFAFGPKRCCDHDCA